MMPEIVAPLARVLLRYLAGVLLAKGIQIDPHDPDTISVLCWLLAGAFGAISEGWWYLAHKKGWAR